jgi:hypothetical protein
MMSCLRFNGNSYLRRRNARLIKFFHRTNYDKFEPLNNAILNFNHCCDLFAFRSEDSCVVLRDRLKSALLEERSFLTDDQPHQNLFEKLGFFDYFNTFWRNMFIRLLI